MDHDQPRRRRLPFTLPLLEAGFLLLLAFVSGMG